jgi:Head binding
MTKLVNPMPLFLDGRGALLDGGYIYIGTTGTDPTVITNQLSLFWDNAKTIPAPQPLRTLGGVVVNGQNPSYVFFNETDYAFTIKDQGGGLVMYQSSSTVTADPVGSYQPLDSDLTAIAALGTTPYGRSLLTLANQAALKAATGIPNCLPLVGGTMTGNIIRSGGGVYAYWASAGFTGARLYLSPSTGADPTSQPGDVWFAY